MIKELFTTESLVILAIILAGYLLYQKIPTKSNPTKTLEREYHEVLNSDKYKVKGQY